MKKKNQGIDLLKVICFVLVVVIHAYSEDVATKEGISSSVQFACAQIIAPVCVPIFFFIFGYLFGTGFSSWNFTIWKQKFVRRVKSLAIPYLLWNVLALVVFTVLFHYFKSERWTYFIDEYGLYGILWNYNGFPINYPLWFLRDLMVLVIVSPIIILIINKLDKILGGVFGLILMVPYVLIWKIPIDGLSPIGILFFYWGIFAKIKIKWEGFRPIFNYVGLLIGLLLAIVCIIFKSNSLLLIRIFYIILTPVLFSLFVGAKQTRFTEFIAHFSELSMFVFGSHAIVLFCLKQFFELYFTNLPDLLSYILFIIITLIICSGLYRLLKRFTPKLLMVLNGFRE